MAEARMAVDPVPASSYAGREIDTDVKKTQVHISNVGFVLYVPHPKFLFRNFRRFVWRMLEAAENALMPVPPYLALGIVCGVAFWASQSKPGTWQRNGWLAHVLWRMDDKNPLSKFIPTNYRVAYLAANFTAAATIVLTTTQRLILRQLLSYHGWISERAKKSTKTKVWAALLKYVFIRRVANKVSLYQGALPTLPLPRIEDTVPKYLATVKPLLSPEDFAVLEAKAKSFLANEGRYLQRWLRLKWWSAPNYISDWWLNYVYLKARGSLCINSNWYGILHSFYIPTKKQTARAAATIYAMLRQKKYLDAGTFEPQVVGGFVPLCMAQYDYIFSTTRVPGREMDKLVVTESRESRHVAVIFKGRFYKVRAYDPNTQQLLTPLQIERSLDGIVQSLEEADPREALLPSLTAANRSEWASIREDYFIRDPINRLALDAIEKSVFVVCLDDEAAPKTLADEGKSYLCGNGRNRWSDKSFNLVVTSNAKIGVHTEHSWGDAPTLAHILEWCSVSDEKKEFYTETGDIKPLPDDVANLQKGTFVVYAAERLRFRVSDELLSKTQAIHNTYLTQIADLDLQIVKWSDYGKEVCKKAKCSPDAWIQMAMQLAYYRDQSRFDQTYESSMTRLFAYGRTETIRTVSDASCAFVLSMVDPNVPKAKRLELLRVACDQHQAYSHDCMIGKGIDRHLFALYVVSVGKATSSPFLEAALSRKWKLSTSQVLTAQVPSHFHHPDTDQFQTPNGGFGPVADDGYGVSYNVYGSNMFHFNVSSKRSAENTDSDRFATQIFQSLREMGQLVSA